MAIEFRCKCGMRIKAHSQSAGRRGRCPKCGTILCIPESILAKFKEKRRPFDSTWCSSWVISLGAHAIVLILLALIVFHSPFQEELEAITVLPDEVREEEPVLVESVFLESPEIETDEREVPNEKLVAALATRDVELPEVELGDVALALKGVEQTAFQAVQSDRENLAVLRDIDQRVTKAGGKTGEVTVSLAWYSYNDIDLHVISPRGERIYFDNRISTTGGVLDVDMNVSPESKRPVENIRWLKNAPEGRYRVLAHLFTAHAANRTDQFVVRLKVGKENKVIRGRVSRRTPLVHVADFTWSNRKFCVSGP